MTWVKTSEMGCWLWNARVGWRCAHWTAIPNIARQQFACDGREVKWCPPIWFSVRYPFPSKTKIGCQSQASKLSLIHVKNTSKGSVNVLTSIAYLWTLCNQTSNFGFWINFFITSRQTPIHKSVIPGCSLHGLYSCNFSMQQCVHHHNEITPKRLRSILERATFGGNDSDSFYVIIALGLEVRMIQVVNVRIRSPEMKVWGERRITTCAILFVFLCLFIHADFPRPYKPTSWGSCRKDDISLFVGWNGVRSGTGNDNLFSARS